MKPDMLSFSRNIISVLPPQQQEIVIEKVTQRLLEKQRQKNAEKNAKTAEFSDTEELTDDDDESLEEDDEVEDEDVDVDEDVDENEEIDDTDDDEYEDDEISDDYSTDNLNNSTALSSPYMYNEVADNTNTDDEDEEFDESITDTFSFMENKNQVTKNESDQTTENHFSDTQSDVKKKNNSEQNISKNREDTTNNQSITLTNEKADYAYVPPVIGFDSESHTSSPSVPTRSVSNVISQSAEPVATGAGNASASQIEQPAALTQQSALPITQSPQGNSATKNQQALAAAEYHQQEQSNMLVRGADWVQRNIFDTIADWMPIGFLKSGIKMIGNVLTGFFKTIGHLFDGNLSSAADTGLSWLKDTAIVGGVVGGALVVRNQIRKLNSKSSSTSNSNNSTLLQTGTIVSSLLDTSVSSPLSALTAASPATSTSVNTTGLKSLAAQTPVPSENPSDNNNLLIQQANQKINS